MGHTWREMDPAGAEAHDRRLSRISKLHEQVGNMSLGKFTVKELEAVMRLFRLAYNGAGTLEPHEEHLALLEKKVAKKKRRA